MGNERGVKEKARVVSSGLKGQPQMDSQRIAQVGSLLDEQPRPDPAQFKEELAPRPIDNVAAMTAIERLARDPNVDPEKLERFMAMQERILRYTAESEFNVAFAGLLQKIPTIVERGHTDKSSYAPLEDIIEKVRPLLAADGFSLSFRTEWPDGKTVKVIGILTHIGGHSRQSEFLSGADNSGSKNAIQALASSVSYGKRYTTKDLLCIVTRGEDDDAESSEKANQPPAPDGYDAWLATLDGVADEGMPAFATAWNKSNKEFRTYLAKTAPKHLAALRNKAAQVKAAK